MAKAKKSDSILSILAKPRYTLRQVAEHLDVHPGTVWRWVNKSVAGRKLVAHRVGGRLYVLEDDLREFLKDDE